MKIQSRFQFSIAAGLALLMLTASAMAGEEKLSPTQVADILHKALTEGDQETLFDVAAPDLLVFEAGGVEASREEYASHHMHSDMKFMANMTRTVIDQQVMQEDAIAVVTTQSTISGTYDEKPLNLNSTETLVMKMEQNGWQIHHIHWSSKSNN